MPILEAHLICCLLVVIDLVTRALRFQWILAGLRTPVSFCDAFVMTTVGDAAAAVTPNRIAAEPTRLAAAAFAGVPVTAAFVAVTYELLVSVPVTCAAAGWLALIYAPRWWHNASPLLAETVRHAWPVLVVLVVAGIIGWILVRRAMPKTSHRLKRNTRRAWAYARRMPAWPLLASAPLTLLGLGARVAILPVLALTLPFPPPMGPAHLRLVRAALRAGPPSDTVGRGGDRPWIRRRRRRQPGRAPQAPAADLARVHDGGGGGDGRHRGAEGVRRGRGVGAREVAANRSASGGVDLAANRH